MNEKMIVFQSLTFNCPVPIAIFSERTKPLFGFRFETETETQSFVETETETETFYYKVLKQFTVFIPLLLKIY